MTGRPADLSGTLAGRAVPSSERVRWWAGIATFLPRGSLVPADGMRILRRVNEYRLGNGRRAIFHYPRPLPDQARRLATPTLTGFGDLLCAWMMPIVLAEMNGWHVRIPVPLRAGGLHHDPTRPQITPDWLHATLALPTSVRALQAESAPDDEGWFCTVEQQWHLNSCMETSYDTIPWWLRGEIDRDAYYTAYRRIARGLVRTPADPFGDGRPYYAVNARRADRGRPEDDHALSEILSGLAARCGRWAVVSDDPATASATAEMLREAGCEVAEIPGPGGSEVDPAAERLRGLWQHFTTLAGARAVVCSVRGGWSAFPYAATRVSDAPLVFTEPLERSIVWRVIRGHSEVPVRGVHHGPSGATEFVSVAAAAA